MQLNLKNVFSEDDIHKPQALPECTNLDKLTHSKVLLKIPNPEQIKTGVASTSAHNDCWQEV